MTDLDGNNQRFPMVIIFDAFGELPYFNPNPKS
jgi:hypothetical protein